MRPFAAAILGMLTLACAKDDDDPAVTTALTLDPSTTGSMSATLDPTASTTTPGDDDVGEEDVVEESSATTETPTDVPGDCMPGRRDCPCDGGECNEGLLCIADVCETPMRCDPDPHEPNDVNAEAAMLPGITDADADGEMLTGVLSDPFDVDWFGYPGTDIVGETVDPARALVVMGGTLELCKFLSCNVGTPIVACPPGSTAAESAGFPGCCSTSSIALDAEGFECEAGAFETSATVYIRLRNADAQCVGYTIDYHY